MSNYKARPVGVLLAAGGVCSSVFAELMRNPNIDPVPICVTQGCESDAGTSEILRFIPLTCPNEIAAYMQNHGVSEVVLAGDVGVLRDAPDQFVQNGSGFDPDPEMLELLDSNSPIYSQLKVLEFRLKTAGITTLHLHDVTQDFNVGTQWIGGAPLCKARRQITVKIDQTVREMRLSGTIENSSRATLVFEDEKLLFSWPENTHRVVEYAGSTPRSKKGSIRSLVKLSTDVNPVTLAAPTLCHEDISHCIEHGIDLVILDSDHIVFAEKKSALAAALDRGITVFGMSFS